MFHSVSMFMNFCDTATTFGDITASCRVEKQSTLYNTLGELYFLEGHYFCYHAVQTLQATKVQTLKNCFDSIFFMFVHACLFLYLAVLFITSFSFLSSYIYVSFSFNVYEFLRHSNYLWGYNCFLQGWKTVNFIQYFGGAVLFGGSLLLLSCGNDWRYMGEEVNISHTANYA